MDKQQIREAMRARRRAVSPAEREEYSRRICHLLAARAEPLLPRLLCCYDALKTEIDLADFIAWCRNRGIRVVFPEKTADGYAVPENSEVDLWICPGLAFTPDGKRLGFGGGWYDRFLSRRKAGSLAWAVAYPWQVFDDLPQEPTDIRLDAVIADFAIHS